MSIGKLGCADDFLVCGIRAAVADIFHNGALKEPCVLQYHAECISQIGSVVIPDIMSVYKNGT